jgi:tetratricopeptide (TPR) repeat protein
MRKPLRSLVPARLAQSAPAGTSTLKRGSAWRADWLGLVGGAILAAGVIAVYSRTFSVPLLFDDIDAIVENPTIQHWNTAWWAPGNTTATGRPVLNLSLALNYAVSGTAVWTYHAFNLAIHVLAGLTLFGIVRRTLGLVGRVIPNPPLSVSDPSDRRVEDNAPYPANATLLAFAAALLWTLHPLQTEAVTYIVQRAESLMGLFYLLTLYCFIRGAEPEGSSCRSLLAGDEQHASSEIACKQAPTLPNTQSSHARCWFAGSVGACLLGMATKEVMVSAPLIMLLYDRTFIAGSFREAWRRRAGLYAALAATWLVLIGLVASTGWNRHGASGFDVGIAPWAYWLTQFEAVSRYVGLSVWPDPLVFEYGTVWVNHPAEVALYALLVVGLAVAVLVALCRRPVIGFLGAWFFAILAPTSIVPGRVQMIVEHRMYLPLAAVMTLAAIGIHAMLKQRGWVVFIALALGLGLLTARRNEDYRSELSIWSDTVAKRPKNERAHNNLGLCWSKMPGRLNDAIAQYEAALQLKPDYADAHNNLGVAWARLPGRSNDAIAEFEAVLRLQPDDFKAHSNLGVALAQIPARLNDAIAHYEAAVRSQPDHAEVHNNLGVALAQMPSRLNDAIAEFEAAVRLNPDDAEAHNNLGTALAQTPVRLNDAIAHYETAVRLNPDYFEAHINLGVVLAQTPGRLPDAIAELEAAVRLKPDDLSAQQALAAALQQAKGH